MQGSFFTFLISLSLAGVSAGQVFDERFEDWPVDLKINGKICVAGDLEEAPLIARLLGKQERSQSTGLLLSAPPSDEATTTWDSLFADQLVQVEDDWTAPILRKMLREHEIVVLGTTTPLSSTEQEAMEAAKEEFTEFIQKGRTLVALGPVSELVSASYLVGSGDQTHLQAGLNLLPDVILETDYENQDDEGRLLAGLDQRDPAR